MLWVVATVYKIFLLLLWWPFQPKNSHGEERISAQWRGTLPSKLIIQRNVYTLNMQRRSTHTVFSCTHVRGGSIAPFWEGKFKNLSICWLFPLFFRSFAQKFYLRVNCSFFTFSPILNDGFSLLLDPSLAQVTWISFHILITRKHS